MTIMKKAVIRFVFTTIFYMIHVSLVHAIQYGLYVGEAYYNWKEYTRCGTVEESGSIWTLGGHVAGAPLVNVTPLRFRGDVEVFTGRVFYDTYYGPAPACNPDGVDSNYLGYKVEGKTGWQIILGRVQVEPFLGLAYRGWRRGIGSNVAAGYPEWYGTLYGQVGLRISYELSRDITLSSNLSADPMFWAKEKIDWTEISGETLKATNGRRLGWTIEGGTRWKHLEATVYWQATRLGKSNEISCQGGASICWQPKSLQDIIGLKLGYLF